MSKLLKGNFYEENEEMLGRAGHRPQLLRPSDISQQIVACHITAKYCVATLKATYDAVTMSS